MEFSTWTIGQVLKARRLELGLSQVNIAELLGIKNDNFISMIEKGRSNLPIARLVDFCTAYELAPEFSACILKAVYPDIWASLLFVMTKSDLILNGSKDSKAIEDRVDKSLAGYVEKYNIRSDA